MKKQFTLVFALVVAATSYAQNVGIGIATPNASAKLDISSTNSGVLIPRLALSSTAVAAPVAAPATSLLVYNTATAGVGLTAVTPGFYYWNGAMWVRLATGNSWNILSNNFNANGTQSIVTDQPATITSTNAAWLVGGNNNPGTRNLGTTNNQHMDFLSNNIVRGRLSNLGEFFIGTTATALPGDLMNGVANATFTWAVNGYSSFNGSGVYGSIQAGTTNFGGVQGEYYGTSNTGAGTRGIAGAGNNLGVHGQNLAVTTGWSGLFQGDLGYTGWFGNASDRRLKKNIETIPNALELILNLRGTIYEHDLEAYPDLGLKTGLNYGFIAQEIEVVLPDLVREKYLPHLNSTVRGTTDSKEAELMKTVSYIEVVPILVEAMKEQQAQIEALKLEIQELKDSIQE